MTRDKQLAAFIAGTIQAALDNARSRGYPPELGLTEARDGTWTIWAADEDSRCTVTIAPGAGLLTRQRRILIRIKGYIVRVRAGDPLGHGQGTHCDRIPVIDVDHDHVLVQLAAPRPWTVRGTWRQTRTT